MSTTEDSTLYSSRLLPFQRTILNELVPAKVNSNSSGNTLLILARGLGLRSIVQTLLEIYDQPENLVLLINAGAEEESEFNGGRTRLKSVNYETTVKGREDVYKSGGVMSVTSRILTVDMLNKVVPIACITGIVILQAHRVKPTSPEAFIVRIFREYNKKGWIKGFTDVPEALTMGIAPLQTVLTQLKIREVLIWPRFHETISADLAKRKADVIEMYQPLTDHMTDIQAAIIDCMEATLSEIKRSNTTLDVEDLTVENALFKSFDVLVRVQLDTVWDKVGGRTKGLVNDLTTLRKLQHYLLTSDCVAFNRFLEITLSTQNTTEKGAPKQVASPWIGTPAGNTIFTLAKDRVYRKIVAGSTLNSNGPNPIGSQNLLDFTGHNLDGYNEEEEAMLRNMEMEEDEEAREKEAVRRAIAEVEKMEEREKNEVEERKKRLDAKWEREKNSWKPNDVEEILEPQPKWSLLAEVLEEIEEELHWAPVDLDGVSNDTILIMCTDSKTCNTLSEYLLTRDWEGSAHSFLHSKLSNYFYWKAQMGKMQRNLRSGGGKDKWGKPSAGGGKDKGKEKATTSGGDKNSTGGESLALKRKDAMFKNQAPSNKRRRVRGGGTITVGERNGNGNAVASGSGATKVLAPNVGADADALELESAAIADEFIALRQDPFAAFRTNPTEEAEEVNDDVFAEVAFNEYFGLVSNEDLVIIRPYMDDDDDRVLEELRPKYIIVYDPDQAFVRRVETYRAAHAGLAVRVYFLVYKDSVEEQRYLSGLRKEKDAFEKIIREKGVMAIPYEAEYREGEETESAALRVISSRIGGGKQASAGPPRVIVDVREFRSSLPSMLHSDGFEVVPITISIGDYIITPEMCVERKSLPDLIGSFNSGRLYQQCELMTTHYKQPMLLIEWDEKKAFNLDMHADPRGKGYDTATFSDNELRSKIVLLAMTFPRLRIIWSSNAAQTVQIFRDLKENREEPDAEKAVLVGADELSGGIAAEGVGESGFSAISQDILRSLPGITTKNYRYVMSKVDDIEALCKLELKELQELIGIEPGKSLYTFMNHSLLDSEVESISIV